MSGFRTFARQAINSLLHNVLNTRLVRIHFNMSPGDDNGGDRAISSLQWQVRAQGFVIQRGTTGADGRIDMSVRGGSSTLELLHGGNAVASYEVRASTAALANVNTLEGQKERLRLLGYQVGHGGPHGNGVNATADVMEFERSAMDFQVDESLYNDSVVNGTTQNRLRTRAGA